MARKSLIVGNWKMNALQGEAQQLLEEINYKAENCDVVVCPPFTTISVAVNAGAKTGGQDCHFHDSGAHTGDISPKMLKDAGCEYVIVGHSERRKDHNESNELINKKALAAHKAGLVTIICIGETLDQRENGKTFDVLAQQISNCVPISSDSNNTVIAYEPIWAIGTGKVASLEQIEETHKYINDYVAEHLPLFNQPVNALYGGSVKADNAKDILSISCVGGVLVGGASLNADSFNAIIDAA